MSYSCGFETQIDSGLCQIIKSSSILYFFSKKQFFKFESMGKSINFNSLLDSHLILRYEKTIRIEVFLGLRMNEIDY